MRTKLGEQEGERKKFRAIFKRIGKKTTYTGYREDTILLHDVREADTLTPIADHVWFSYTKGFEKINLTENCVIEFEARVKSYRKGYINKSLGLTNRASDYKLSHPTRIKKIAP